MDEPNDVSLLPIGGFVGAILAVYGGWLLLLGLAVCAGSVFLPKVRPRTFLLCWGVLAVAIAGLWLGTDFPARLQALLLQGLPRGRDMAR